MKKQIVRNKFKVWPPNKKLEKRMYFLTMYNLSGIQKGIQCGHAALRYALKYKRNPEIWDFIKNHETWIILSGGGSKDMESHWKKFQSLGVRCEKFHEPDLNGSLSAICLIVDERVFSKNYDGAAISFNKDLFELREFLKNFNLASN